MNKYRFSTTLGSRIAEGYSVEEAFSSLGYKNFKVIERRYYGKVKDIKVVTSSVIKGHECTYSVIKM